jgi:protein-S-isoprenylcysteine O-methyltransferase Ste14
VKRDDLAMPVKYAKPGEHRFGDLGQILLLVLFGAGWAVDSLFLHTFAFFSSLIPWYMQHPLADLLFLLAVLLFLSGRRVITHHGQQPKKLITDGVFNYVRHPVYLASILFFIGLTLYTISILSLVLLIAVFAFYNYIADYEEKFLEERFGAEYRRYRQRTGKWFPRLS